MEDSAFKMNQILDNLKGRHKQVDNLMSLTREMAKVIEINDLESLGAVLSMRQKSMDIIDGFNSDIKNIIESLAQPEKDKVRQILDTDGAPVEFANHTEIDISKTNKMTLALVQKVIELDRALNQKIQKNAASNAPAG